MQYNLEFQQYINLPYIMASQISLQGPYKIMIYNENLELGMQCRKRR